MQTLLHIKLANMISGEQGEIIGFEECDKSYRIRLLSMGLTQGTKFTVVCKAPLGDPICIEIRGTRLSLRKDEAHIIKIKKVT